ncbi:hypothetical protein EVAR_11328_1 [Eumeta japonica]|uniref:Uncharacterized protein n=1 Tax=Eumeta variegata TaxID=151549 RepID=A0A4C1U137_EUMVA|nr:hypothetical protein EVAR_11328_1 [Eumeta japonica]
METAMSSQPLMPIQLNRKRGCALSDLNAKHKAWGSHSISRAGRLLMEDAELQGYEVLGPDTPTRTCLRTSDTDLTC